MRQRIVWAALASSLVALALALSAVAAHPAAPSVRASTWNVVTSLPQGLYGAAGASNGTFAYAAGGYASATGTTLDTFYRYNPVNERWETFITPMPAPEAMASAVYYPTTNKVYVFGGIDPNTGVVSNATKVLDITANEWSTAANLPAPRHSMAAGYNEANGRIYLAGGFNTADPSSAQITTWEYNPATNTFTPRADLPHAVGSAASGVVAGHLYVAGGHDTSGVVDLTWDYDIAANTWTPKASMPTPTNAPGSAAAIGKLWSFGGETPSDPTAGTVSYDPATNSWASAPNMNVARSAVSGAAIGNRLVAAGGKTAATPTAATEVLDAATASCAEPTTTFSEAFDGVTPPALPAGWTATNAVGSPPPLWETSHTGQPTPPFDTAPNAVCFAVVLTA